MPITDIRKYNKELMKAEESKSAHPGMQLQDKKPVIVDTYYNLNRKSSVSDNMGRIETYIDPNTSPLKFNAINNLIIYGYSEDGETTTEHPQLGTKQDAVFKSIIMANAFQPYVGDFIKLQIDDGWLFVVTNVLDINNVTFINQSMYEITYKKYVPSSSTKYTDIDKQVSDELVYMPENVGTDKALLVNKTDYDTSVDILASYMNLVTQYIKQFYHKVTNSFLVVDYYNPKNFIYSSYVTEFICKNAIIYMPTKDIELYISHEALLRDDFQLRYECSLFAKVEDGDDISLDDLSTEYIKAVTPGEINPFSHFYLTFDTYLLLEDNYDMINILRNTSGISDGSVFSIMDKTNDAFNQDLIDLVMVPNAIKKYSFKKLKFSRDNITAYLLVPIILYHLQMEYDALTGGNKTMNSVLTDIFGV